MHYRQFLTAHAAPAVAGKRGTIQAENHGRALRGRDPLRPQWHSVFPWDNKLVATDGRRLALFDSDIEFPQSHERDFIVPTKAVTEIQRLLGEDEKFRSPSRKISSPSNWAEPSSSRKLVEGNYPNYRQVIPGEAKERITLEREAFLTSIRRVSLLSSDKTSSVRLKLRQEQPRHHGEYAGSR